MYIPIHSTARPSGSEAAPCPDRTGSGPFPGYQSASSAVIPYRGSAISHIWNSLWSFFASSDGKVGQGLRRRKLDPSQAHDLNVTIGIVVGVCVGLFFIGLLVFFYFYGRTIRLTEKRRRKRKSSGSSKSSKSSKSSTSSEPPPPPPPAPPSAPPPPPEE